jgi:hypothetical protein
MSCVRDLDDSRIDIRSSAGSHARHSGRVVRLQLPGIAADRMLVRRLVGCAPQDIRDTQAVGQPASRAVRLSGARTPRRGSLTCAAAAHHTMSTGAFLRSSRESSWQSWWRSAWPPRGAVRRPGTRNRQTQRQARRPHTAPSCQLRPALSQRGLRARERALAFARSMNPTTRT